MNDSGLGSFKPDTVAEECQNELDTLKAENKALREQLSTAFESLAVAEKQIADGETDQALVQAELDRTLAELAELKENPPPAIEQNPAPAIELPESADLLNQLKTRRKKSTATLSDIEAILEMIEKSCDDTSQEN